jgi:hypothetical protein
VSSEPRACSACGFAADAESKFCPNCGRKLVGDHGSPHLYGVLSPGPAFVLGCVLLAAAVVAGVAGSAITAIVLLALAGAAFVFFYDAAKRDPTSPLAQRVTSSGHHLRGWARFVGESTAAWAGAIRAVVRLGSESRSLRRERKRALHLLGEAAYREDEPEVDALRTQLRQIDDGLAERDRQRDAALARARRHVEEEHSAARRTEQFTVDELTSGGAEK